MRDWAQRYTVEELAEIRDDAAESVEWRTGCVIGPGGLCVNCSAACGYESACDPEDAIRTLAEVSEALTALGGTGARTP